jgi:hypothetical protein
MGNVLAAGEYLEGRRDKKNPKQVWKGEVNPKRLERPRHKGIK